jgi:arginyl-tRNA synthetase
LRPRSTPRSPRWKAEGVLPHGLPRGSVSVEPPRDASARRSGHQCRHGAGQARGTNPRALAEALVAKLAADPASCDAEIAGPGFINLRWPTASGTRSCARSLRWRRLRPLAPGGGKRINVEYVSANPTGPMHMGHCRGAVVGDALAGLLEFAGTR